MKTLAIKTPTAELLIIELPEGTISYQYSSNLETISAEVPNDKGVSFEQSRIEKGYTLLGKPDEIKEEDAELLVESKFIDFWYPNEFDGYGFDKFKNYKTGEFSEVDAKESLLSFIESEIYWVNPIKVHTWASENADMYLKQWHEAQEKTFDRKRTLIFFKLLSN